MDFRSGDLNLSMNIKVCKAFQHSQPLLVMIQFNLTNHGVKVKEDQRNFIFILVSLI